MHALIGAKCHYISVVTVFLHVKEVKYMESLAHKTKISVLWLFFEASYFLVLILLLYDPHGLQQVMTGEILGIKLTSEYLFFTASLLLIPLVMAFASLALKDSIDRWANIILGLVYTGIQLITFVGIALANPPAYAILIETAKTVVPALIVWYAYRWPKEAAQAPKTPVLRETVRV